MSDAKQGNKESDQGHDWASKRIEHLYSAGAFVALGVMVVLLGFGLCKTLQGTFYLVWPFEWPWVSVTFEQGVECFLKGIEILILAPLVCLVFTTICKYMGSVLQITMRSQVNPEEQNRAEQRLHEFHNLFQQVKQIIAGLFISLLLTDSISKIIKTEELTWFAIVAQGSSLGLAIAYYYVLCCRPGNSPTELRNDVQKLLNI